MVSRFSILIIAFLIFPLFTNSEVVINELNFNPMDLGDEVGPFREFIELYNPDTVAVDLSGYSFTSGIQYTFPNNTRLEAGAYLILARVPTLSLWRNRSYPVYGPYEGKLSNDGERIMLQRPDGSLVDQFKYEADFPWPRGADGYGPTLERIAWDLSSNDFHSWRASLQDNGTPGAQNSVAGTQPRPIIRSYSISPEQPTSSNPVQIQIGVDAPELISHAFLRWETNDKTPPRGVVNSNDTWRMWKGKTAPANGLEWTTRSFDDSVWENAQGGFGYGDLEQVNTALADMRGSYSTVYIRRKFTVEDPGALGILSLHIFYDDGFICYINGVKAAQANAPDPYNHTSLAGGSHEAESAESFELGAAANWLAAGENVIALVGLNNSLGNSTDFVLAAALSSSAQSGGGQRIPMSFAGITIDGVTYQATIPAQNNQTLVRFNLELELLNGKQVILPHAAEPHPFESYFVYDQDIPSKLPVLWLFPDGISHLPERTGAYSTVVVKPTGNEPLQVFDGVAVIPARNGQKIKFLKGEEFRGDRTLNLSLEAPIEGTTAGPQSPHAEHISYQLFRDFGVLTPRCDWFRVIENNQHYQRVAVQQPNEQFLKLNGRNPEGNLYKIAYNEPGGYSKKTNLDEGDEDFRELFQHINVNNTKTLSEDLRTYLVVEEIMGYEVAVFLLSHWDGFKNNIFLYHQPAPGNRWEMIPWDVDKTFGYTDSDPMYWEMPIDFPLTGISPGSPELTGRNLVGVIGRPFHMDSAFHQEFVDRVAAALDGLFSLPRVGGMIDDAQNLLLTDLDLIDQYTGTLHNKRRNQIVNSYDTLRYFLTHRHEFLRTQLPTDFKAVRSLPASDYHAGSTLPGIKVTISALGGKTISVKVVERIPDRFTAANIQTTMGGVSVVGNTIVWILSDISTQAVLVYDLVAPVENPPMRATITGTITENQIDYSLGDAQLKYLPENVHSLSSDWVVGSGGTWTIVDGVLNGYAEDATDPKHVWVNRNFGTGDYTVQADVRMVDWIDGDYARAGVAVRVNPTDGERALNFLFHEDTGSVDMLNDLIKWGTQGTYSWKVGEWYTMTLTAVGSKLEGQIRKTGTNEEPTIMIWDDSQNSLRSPGYPGLTASSMPGLTAQFDNFVVIVNGKVVFADDFNVGAPVSDWQLY